MKCGMKRALPLALLLVGFSPFQAESPEVSRGNQALRAGDPASALEHYDRAQSKLGNRAELDYDRGNAFFAQKRFEEARDAYKKALTGPDGLKSRDYYNLGNALARLDSSEEALDAFRKALAMDPQNEDARYNLEVMLRRKQAQQQPQQQKDQKPQKSGDSPDGGTRAGKDDQKDDRDGGDKKDARDGGTDGADAGRQQERDAGADPRDGGARPQPEESRDGGQPEQAQQSGSQDGGRGDQDGRQADAAQMSRQDAEKLLDAMRARERNMPMSPAGQNPRRARSSNAAKDW
jgi:Ca-activated chloride channel family protein